MRLLPPLPKSSHLKCHVLRSNGVALGWDDKTKQPDLGKPPVCCCLEKDLHPVLRLECNADADVLMNGFEADRKDPETIALLYNGYKITVFREGNGCLEFACNFDKGPEARARGEMPVIFFM